MSIALEDRRVSIRFVWMLLAFVVAVMFGGVGGYAARTLSVPAPASSSNPAGACAPGTHPVVWYSARAWACVNDGE